MTSVVLDYTNCLSGTIGATHGLTPGEIDTLVAKFPRHHQNLEDLRARGIGGFWDLPTADLTPVEAALKRHRGKWEAVVVMGAGGAVITPLALVKALGGAHWNCLPTRGDGQPRILTLTNGDPQAFDDILATVEAKKTLFLVISRSGTTAEVSIALMAVQAWLRKKGGKSAVADQILIATEANHGPLAQVATNEGCGLLPLPANLPDRFGMLGPASLFLAGLCGFDIHALRSGAADMDQRCRHGDALRNPAYMHSLVHYLLTRKRRKTIHALMAFAGRLEGLAAWYDHLIAVSLGKMLNTRGKAVHVGPSPMHGVGPADLHGLHQLYAEGPYDKVLTFLTVADHGSTVEAAKVWPKIDGLGYLGGATLRQACEAAYMACAQAITASGRPNLTFVLPRCDEHAIGAWAQAMMLSTAMSAELYGIDAFDAPGVDAGKQAVYAQLGRSGFEDKARVLADYRNATKRTC